MSNIVGAGPKPVEAGHTSVRFGPAFLRPHPEEEGHYELMRPVLTVTNEGDRTVTQSHGDPIPVAVYRPKRPGDKHPQVPVTGPPVEMRTTDPQTMQPLTLILVWYPGMDAV